MIKDSFPKVTGHVLIQTRKDDKLIQEVYGHNIWTNTGRQFLAQLISLSNYSNNTPIREDRISYIGMGTGSQLEDVNVTTLVNPVAYDAFSSSPANYLALIDSSSISINSGNGYTGVTFQRDFDEDSLVQHTTGAPYILTETGLFTNGDQNNDFQVPIPNFAISGPAASFAPVAYKTFDPISKTRDYTLRISWQVRFS